MGKLDTKQGHVSQRRKTTKKKKKDEKGIDFPPRSVWGIFHLPTEEILLTSPTPKAHANDTENKDKQE
jgi:hypothetical protein